MNYWLMKSEPDVFGIEHLNKLPNKTEHWDGVRNYQARNMMRDSMKKGDCVLFYHSNCDLPGVVGLAEVAKEAYPDFTAWDVNSKYYDVKSSLENPRWFMVNIRFKTKFKRTVSLAEMREQWGLQDMPLVRKGNRLSIMSVTKKQWEIILAME